MKKGLSILLCACLLFGLCACTGQNGAKSKETTTVSTTASTTKSRRVQPKNAKRILEMFAGVTVRQG